MNALLLTSAVNDWMTTTHHPRILHIFDRACNLINEHKQIVSIVTPEIGRGPFNLVVDKPIDFTDHINLQSPILSTPDELHIGSLVIHTKHAKRWNARPNWEILHAHRVSIGQHTLNLSDIQSPISSLQFSSSLSSALAIADLSSAVQAAHHLAGLGQGLTPSGDDYIMGALYATWIIHPEQMAEPLAREIANTTSPRTTSLSAAWIKAAGHGEAGMLWHGLFQSLFEGERNDIETNLSKIRSVGSTSGADALAGFISTFISYIESERKHVVPKVL